VGKATSQFAINGQMGTAAFAALNSVKAGCVAYIESEEKGCGMPVLIVNAQTSSAGGGDKSSGVAFHPRCMAVANEGSLLSLVQMCIDLDDDTVSSSSSPRPTLVNGYTQIYVGKDANVTHSFLDESGGIVTPNIEMSDEEFKAEFPDIIDLPREVESQRPALRNVNFQVIDAHIVGDSGSYISSVLELGGTGRSRIAVSATLLRPGAFASIDGFALSGGAQRTDMRTNIHHVAQGTISRQEQRNMVGGRSTASFRGRIRVEQSAQQTDSKQLSRTVLLSDYARIWATPSLEIVADDVQCTHGATVSDLSEEELFYLRSRGLDRATARNMLMYAFVDEIVKGEGKGVDDSIVGGFDDENGLRRRIIRRLENVVPKGEKYLVGGEFQSS
jgi:Fe-S cluster assembly protein SufD